MEWMNRDTVVIIAAAVMFMLAAGAMQYVRKNSHIELSLRLLFLLAAGAAGAAGCILNNTEPLQGVFMLLLVNGLYIMSLEDIETESVPSVMLWMMILAGTVCSILHFMDGGAGRILIFCVLFAVLHMASRRGKLGIGTADAKMISASALFMNADMLFSVLFMSLMISLVYGIYMMIKKKSGIRTELPFMPFLLMGTLVCMIV